PLRRCPLLGLQARQRDHVLPHRPLLAANAMASSGVLERMRAPATRNRFCIPTSAAICFIAPDSLSTIGRGVAAGSTKAAHEVTTKSFTPASTIVGTSGKVGQRLAEVTAKARIFPDWMTER